MNKPAFNPNESFETYQEKPSFDPNQAFKVYEEPKISEVESFGRGVAQGSSLGFADEISGGVEALWAKAKGNPEEFGKLYKKYRDESRENFKTASKVNPGSFTSGEFAGGVGTAFVPGLGIAKGAKIADVAIKSGQIGAAMGIGYSEGETVDDVLRDGGESAVLGMATGAALNKAAPFVAKGAKRAGEKLSELAERFAARAMGAERGTIKKLGDKKVQEVGRYALDNKILSPLANTDDKIERNLAEKIKAGNKMDQVYSAIDDAGVSEFNPLDVASKVDDELGGFYRSPINKGEARQLENTLESILIRGEGNIPLKEAQALKQEIGRVANWKNNINITEKEKMAREAYKIVSQAIDDAAESGAKKIGKEGLQMTLKEGLKDYSNSKAAGELLTNKQAREQGNKLIGLTDWQLLGGAGAGSMAAGLPVASTSIAALGAKKLAEKYGAQNAAIILDRAAKGLRSSISPIKNANANAAVIDSVDNILEFVHPEKVLSSVAENKPLKGKEKWAAEGEEKIKKHDPSISEKIDFEKVKKSKKGQALLMRASDLKPNSKAFAKVLRDIKNLKVGIDNG